MSQSEKTDQSRRIESIPVEQNVPPDKEDILSLKEEIDLSAGKQATYWKSRHTHYLDRQLTEAHEELKKLRPVDTLYYHLRRSHWGLRFWGTVTAIAMAIGSGIISTFSMKDDPKSCMIGWAGLGSGACILAIKSLLGFWVTQFAAIGSWSARRGPFRKRPARP